ncbi:MAG: helix-turn-helix domain-containing protein [Candidatus Parvarchaeota archaeon]|nr:helix-turn-helix domain-containing protein [Candidatus Parvarchaeota archaeon]
MLTAYKFRVYPNEEQKETFSRYFGCSRAKIHERVTNQRNDFLHKVSTAITKRFDTIIIHSWEDVTPRVYKSL